MNDIRIADKSLARLQAGEKLKESEVEWVPLKPGEEIVGMYSRPSEGNQIPWPYMLRLDAVTEGPDYQDDESGDEPATFELSLVNMHKLKKETDNGKN